MISKNTTTRGVVLRSFEAQAPLTIETVKLRPLRKNEVLIKIAAASINPSDLIFLRDQYGIHKSLPIIPGFEGAGTVIETGASKIARQLLDRRVAFHAPEDGHGTWAQHMIAEATECVELNTNLSFEEGCSLVVNPFTAWALLQEAKCLKAKVFVHTAAAGAVGKMLTRLARRLGMRSISVIRHSDQTALLKRLGANAVLSSQEPNFVERLRDICQQEKVSVAFDSVGGRLTGVLANALLPGGHVFMYGGLSGEACQVFPKSFIFENKTVSGFWVTAWLKTLSVAERRRLSNNVQRRMKDDLATSVQARYPLEQINEAIRTYKENRSDGKVLLIP